MDSYIEGTVWACGMYAILAQGKFCHTLLVSQMPMNCGTEEGGTALQASGQVPLKAIEPMTQRAWKIWDYDVRPRNLAADAPAPFMVRVDRIILPKVVSNARRSHHIIFKKAISDACIDRIIF